MMTFQPTIDINRTLKIWLSCNRVTNALIVRFSSTVQRINRMILFQSYQSLIVMQHWISVDVNSFQFPDIDMQFNYVLIYP